MPSRRKTRALRPAFFLLLAALVVLIEVVPGCEDPVREEEKLLEPPQSAEAVVQALAYSYQHQDFEVLRSLLVQDRSRNAEYSFYLSEASGPEGESWGADEESRIHRRMFDPGHPLEGESPVHADLWLAAVDIHLTPLEPFEETRDFYSADGGADGKLDPAIWKVVHALYGTDVFFDTQSENDYQVEGGAHFFVLEDLTKSAGADRKFLLYIWEDLESWDLPKPRGPEADASARGWGQLKALYR